VNGWRFEGKFMMVDIEKVIGGGEGEVLIMQRRRRFVQRFGNFDDRSMRLVCC
jgi:hypothetical protein